MHAHRQYNSEVDTWRQHTPLFSPYSWYILYSALPLLRQQTTVYHIICAFMHEIAESRGEEAGPSNGHGVTYDKVHAKPCRAHERSRGRYPFLFLDTKDVKTPEPVYAGIDGHNTSC